MSTNAKTLTSSTPNDTRNSTTHPAAGSDDDHTLTAKAVRPPVKRLHNGVSNEEQVYSTARVLVTKIAVFAEAAGFLSFLAAVKSCPEAPLYAVVCLLWGALYNSIGATVHILFQDSGLETIAGFRLGEPSVARSLSIFLHTQEGLHRMYMNSVNVFIAIFVPELTFLFLVFNLMFYCVQICLFEFGGSKSIFMTPFNVQQHIPAMSFFRSIIFATPAMLAIATGKYLGHFDSSSKYFIREEAIEALQRRFW
uniref:Uncharacterized protein n=1 Tax=Leptocylindrus danicus TaxID=163516 RepID=A0A7S2NQT5_9STRA|mmetsp:Transcript_10049/g.15060  ORF Transcript_10049/g.15060 Transcript_10049/m.15060 type:complete len:252 (+) Transcript_10049:39-794(+)